jgi:hypothetical protein
MIGDATIDVIMSGLKAGVADITAAICCHGCGIRGKACIARCWATCVRLWCHPPQVDDQSAQAELLLLCKLRKLCMQQRM